MISTNFSSTPLICRDELLWPDMNPHELLTTLNIQKEIGEKDFVVSFSRLLLYLQM